MNTLAGEQRLIQIVGVGCPACRQLEADVRAWIAQRRIEARVERVDDLIEILHHRLLALPGLVVDGCVVMTGYRPDKVDRVLRKAFGGVS